MPESYGNIHGYGIDPIDLVKVIPCGLPGSLREYVSRLVGASRVVYKVVDMHPTLPNCTDRYITHHDWRVYYAIIIVGMIRSWNDGKGVLEVDGHFTLGCFKELSPAEVRGCMHNVASINAMNIDPSLELLIRAEQIIDLAGDYIKQITYRDACEQDPMVKISIDWTPDRLWFYLMRYWAVMEALELDLRRRGIEVPTREHYIQTLADIRHRREIDRRRAQKRAKLKLLLNKVLAGLKKMTLIRITCGA